MIFSRRLTMAIVRKHLITHMANNINNDAVICKTRDSAGVYKITTGFFDGDQLSDVYVWESKNVDEDIARLKDNEVVIVR